MRERIALICPCCGLFVSDWALSQGSISKKANDFSLGISVPFCFSQPTCGVSLVSARVTVQVRLLHVGYSLPKASRNRQT